MSFLIVYAVIPCSSMDEDSRDITTFPWLAHIGRLVEVSCVFRVWCFSAQNAVFQPKMIKHMYYSLQRASLN